MIGMGVGEMNIVMFMGMMMSGLWGVPLGLPPAPEDPVMQNVATEQCLFFSTWSAVAKPDAASSNLTEQMLAEPDVQRFAKTAFETIELLADQMARGVGEREAAILAQLGTKGLRWILSETGAVVVSEVRPDPEHPDLKGCVVIRLGETGRDIPALLLQLQSTAPPGIVTPFMVAGKTCYRLQLDEKLPEIAWGVFDGYWLAGVGEGQLAAAAGRMQGQPPNWLATMMGHVPVERRSTFAYFNAAGVAALAREAGPPQVAQYIDGLGAGNLTALVSATGLEGDGMVSRTTLVVNGEPQGLFAPLAAPGLTKEELAGIPADALIAGAIRLDLASVLDNYLNTISLIDARAALEIRDGIRELEEGLLRLRLREDLLQALGDSMYLYTAPGGGGIITGWTAVAEVKDRNRLQRINDMLLGFARGAAENGAGLMIQELKLDDHTVSFMVFEGEVPFSPAWCLTDKSLVFGLYPQAVVAHLRHSGGPSLLDAPDVQALWDEGAAPLSLTYLDTRRLFEYAYPFVQIMATMASAQMANEGIYVDASMLPPASAFMPHLRPLVAVSRRTDAGYEVVQRQTLPSGNVGASAPVLIALLLPAVQSARDAAGRTQSMNNLKQIGLAMHNYHDVHRTLPAAYNTDPDGKPLLSWRVHILPFIEQQPLYDQFHFDEPWDSPHNRQLIEMMPQVYRSPQSTAPPGMTTYVAPRGEQMIISPPRDGEDGKQFPRSTSFAQITDGTSNTIAVVEANDEAAVIWTKPDDLEVDLDNPLEGLTGLNSGVFLTLLMDGSVRAMSEFIDEDVLRALFTRNGGEAVNVP